MSFLATEPVSEKAFDVGAIIMTNPLAPKRVVLGAAFQAVVEGLTMASTSSSVDSVPPSRNGS